MEKNKNNSKIIIALVAVIVILAGVLVFIITQKSNDDDKDSNSTSASDTVINETTAEPSDNTEQTTEEITSENSDVEFSLGEIDGNVYTNKYFDLTFTKNKSWYYYTKSEIANLMNVTVDVLELPVDEIFNSSATVIDMVVTDLSTTDNINIGYQNLNTLNLGEMSEEDYYVATKAQLEQISTMKVVFDDDTGYVKLGNNDYYRCSCLTQTGNVSMTQYLYFRNVNGYMITITVSLSKNSDVQITEFEAMFS